MFLESHRSKERPHKVGRRGPEELPLERNVARRPLIIQREGLEAWAGRGVTRRRGDRQQLSERRRRRARSRA